MSYNLLQSFLFLVTVQSTCEFKYLTPDQTKLNIANLFLAKKKKGLALDVNFRGEATLDIGPFYLWQHGISED